ncbi:MFS transporter [Mucilaginibacter polytrichastri]|uniref:MFS transporter n=1 Tax=Mucilaginibacter polytrichastri TaxID=1302689 RepID=UPI0008E9E55D|nr:MFS transporter [Mucilaginibacter polytrichastri]SFT22036.1 MFS transporter, MHS family, alpha-ketoglutarate permease [Mucilaginibacter polytrichastri]
MEQVTLSKSQIIRSRVKGVVGGSIGNLVEWYDWYAYSVFALYFGGAFFPKQNETVQLLNTAGIFAIGFLMRPIGGWVMGTYADRKGRKAALTLSVLLMSAGSLIIMLVPGYKHIGIAAPIILVLARMLQGLSIGGEYGTAATYLSEIAPKKHRGFYSSFQYVTSCMGQLIALTILLVLQRFLLTKEQLGDWGWRIPFGLGAVLAVSAIYLRRSLLETESFKNEKVSLSRKGTLTELLKYKKEVLLIVGFTIGTTVAFYTFTTYIQKFLVNTAGFSKNDSTTITMIALFVFMIAHPIAGVISDRVGRKKMMIIYGVLSMVTTYPIMMALGTTHNFVTAVLLITLALIILSLCTSISAIIKAELFPANVRSLGVSFPYALAVAIFGGTAESVALGFKQAGHANYFFWYITACSVVSLIVSFSLPNMDRFSKMDEELK